MSIQLIPIIISIDYFFGEKPNLLIPLRPRFYPYYLWMAVYFFVAIRFIAYRAQVAESFMSTFFSKRIFTYFSETGLVVLRIPVIGDILQPLTPVVAGGEFHPLELKELK